jgi:hypothetical protein
MTIEKTTRRSGAEKPRAKRADRSQRAKKPKASGKLSAINAAVKVLGEADQPMSCHEMIEAMAAKGYWTSPNGLTPAGTLYSSIVREMRIKGTDARFVKASRGKFVLRT